MAYPFSCDVFSWFETFPQVASRLEKPFTFADTQMHFARTNVMRNGSRKNCLLKASTKARLPLALRLAILSSQDQNSQFRIPNGTIEVSLGFQMGYKWTPFRATQHPTPNAIQPFNHLAMAIGIAIALRRMDHLVSLCGAGGNCGAGSSNALHVFPIK